jgi:mono/diheme cytochrome c family protein
MKKSGFFTPLTVLLLAALVLSGVGLLSSCSSPYRYSSNGERIYFTATSSSGQSITSSGGATTMMFRRTTCVSCHGPEGAGGRVNMMMMRSFDVPDITWDKLTETEHGDVSGEAEHEEHPPYTEETLKRAITRGIDPGGELLDDLMPRWRMSEEDLNDLVDFIKALK